MREAMREAMLWGDAIGSVLFLLDNWPMSRVQFAKSYRQSEEKAIGTRGFEIGVDDPIT